MKLAIEFNNTLVGYQVMIKIYPFQPWMPDAAEASRIACEPYDVISTQEAKQAADGNDISFLHVIRPEIGFSAETDPYSEPIYLKAAENLNSLQNSGHLSQAEEPAIYVYRQIFQGRAQHGVVCCYDVQNYRSGEIKKHEKTRPVKEDDRTRHLTTCSAHAEPVFLTFKDDSTIDALIVSDVSGSHVIDFEASDGVQHTIWKAANAQAYVDAFASLDAVYIADGHHRTAAGERAATQRQSENSQHTGDEEYNRVLSVMFPASQMRILAYNRVVSDLNGLTEDEVLEKLASIGTIEKTDNPVPGAAGSVCVYFGDGWSKLTFSPDTIDASDPINSLDVALLQSQILTPILGVGDPRTDERIGFVGGIRGTDELEHLVDTGKKAVAFSMFPTSIEQLLNVSDADKIMPPKSTWFEPKLRSGLFIHRFESY